MLLSLSIKVFMFKFSLSLSLSLPPPPPLSPSLPLSLCPPTPFLSLPTPFSSPCLCILLTLPGCPFATLIVSMCTHVFIMAVGLGATVRICSSKQVAAQKVFWHGWRCYCPVLLLVSLVPPPMASPPPVASSQPALSYEHGFHGTWISNQVVQMTIEQVHVYGVI